MNRYPALLAVISLFISSCSVSFQVSGKTACNGTPIEQWSDVLSRHVDDRGRVAFSRVASSPNELECFVSSIQATAPWSDEKAFSSDNERKAFFINSYNALAMYGVIKKGIPLDFDSDLKRADFFYLTNYTVGGRLLSLYQYENEVIRKLGDPRIHFALNCMSVGCPRLPRTPFIAERLDDQLESGAREFFNSDAYVSLQPERKVVRLSEILKFYTDDFVGEQKAKSLTEYVNRYRDVKIPADYIVEFIPYDWKVNTQ